VPVHSSVTDREYERACARLRGIINVVTRTDLDGSHPTRPVLVGRLTGEIKETVTKKELRKADGPRLQAYAEGLLSQMEQHHTERRCWHETSRTWRPDREGKAYDLGRLPAEAGIYAPNVTVTFWRPAPGDESLRVYNGSVDGGYGTRYSEWGSTDFRQPKAPALFSVMAHSEYQGRQSITPDTLGLLLPGRHGAGQTDAILSRSGLLDLVVLNHTPFLLFVIDPNIPGLRVMIARTVTDVLCHDDEVPVMLQWPGAKRSDWFHFTVGDLRAHLNRQAEARR
jgi:hypothetical protein